jgi:thioredoxin 1
MANSYAVSAPSREEVDSTSGPLILEFGTDWCGHCQAAAPIVAEASADYQDVPHLKIEDGPGRKLGRSFKVKLWPTIILLKDGAEVARFVRPSDAEGMRAALAQIA